MKAVMNMYKEALSQVKVEGEDSKEFAMKVGIIKGQSFRHSSLLW